MLRCILEKGWSARTSYLANSEYDGSIKSLGQCYVTARALHHGFGWEILYSQQDVPNEDYLSLEDAVSKKCGRIF